MFKKLITAVICRERDLVAEGGVKTAEVCSIHFLWGQCILGVGKEKEGR